MEDIADEDIQDTDHREWNDDGKPHATWCMTLFNYDEDDLTLVRNWALVCQRISASEEKTRKGRDHIQMHITWGVAKRFTAVKKMHPTAFWCPAVAKEAFEYPIKKGSKVIVIADNRKQGLRSDINAAYAAAKEGCSIRAFMETKPAPQAMTCFFKAAPFRRPERDLRTPLEVIWIYGPTGCGKTDWAKTNYPDYYIKKNNNIKWWDGFLGNETVIIDEYRPEFSTFQELLCLLNPGKYDAEIKGGFIELTNTRFIFTSIHHPMQMWAGQTDEDLAQLARRITKIMRYTGFLEFVEEPTAPRHAGMALE